MIKRVIQYARQGYKEIDFPIYDTDWDSEAYLTVSGQKATYSVQRTYDFLRAPETDGNRHPKTRSRRDLWENQGYAALETADPVILFNTTILVCHTCNAAFDIRAN